MQLLNPFNPGGLAICITHNRTRMRMHIDRAFFKVSAVAGRLQTYLGPVLPRYVSAARGR